jgi:hypothetical protein
MSQTFDVTSVVARQPAHAEDHADQARVLIFCAVGLAISLNALLIAPDWLFQPQDLLQLP